MKIERPQMPKAEVDWERVMLVMFFGGLAVLVLSLLGLVWTSDMPFVAKAALTGFISFVLGGFGALIRYG